MFNENEKNEILKNEDANISGDNTLEQKDIEQPRIFTQQEVDEIVKNRLARALKNMPSKEEFSEFESLKKQNEVNESVIEKLKAESEINMQRLLTYERYELVNKKGIDEKFKDFALYEAEKLISEDVSFDTALDTVIENNFWLVNNSPYKTGISQGTKDTYMSALEESFYKRNPNLREF